MHGSLPLRLSLVILSVLSLTLGVAFLILNAHDPIKPLLAALFFALVFLAWRGDAAPPLRTALLAAWLGPIAALLLIAFLSVYFQSAANAYPVGDGAMIEIYTVHAVRGIWKLGPYSQFGWNHPGPLFFYLLAPFYVLSGEKTIALHVGAFVINLASVLTIVVVLLREAAPAVAAASLIALSIYLFRLQPLAASYWNPHVVVLGVAALLVLAAALAAGRRAALPGVVFVGSFLAQTHVSLVPYVLALSGGALLAAGIWPGRERRSLVWWISASVGLLFLLWLFPIADELSHTPGNFTSLVHFFTASNEGQPFGLASAVWGELMCAPFRPGLAMPVGWPLKPDGNNVYTLAAAVQLVLLGVSGWTAARDGRRFEAALCAIGMLASLTALWSIVRIRALVGDYMVFWMSAIGVLNWAVIAGLGVLRFAGVAAVHAQVRRLALAASGLTVAILVCAGVTQIEQARLAGWRRLPDSAKRVKALTEQLTGFLQRQRVQRPLVQVAQGAWGDAAGVILQLYRGGLPLAVSGTHIAFFGDPLTPTGREDRVLVIADPRVHAELAQQAGDELVAQIEDIAIHARPRD